MINYRRGMAVVTAAGEQVGHVKDLVVTPRAHNITHLVIGRGFMFTEEKVMPVNWISGNDGDKLILNTEKTKFDQLPNFKEQEYIQAPANVREPALNYDELVSSSPVNPSNLYYLGAPGIVPATGILADFNGPIYISRETKNIPEGASVLDVGGRVISQDKQHVGNLEQVVTSDKGVITHFMMSKGLLFKTHKLVPADWIDYVENNTIHLLVPTETLQNLPDYDQA